MDRPAYQQACITWPTAVTTMSRGKTSLQVMIRSSYQDDRIRTNSSTTRALADAWPSLLEPARK